MKEQFVKYKDLLTLDRLNIYHVVGLVSAWMFGLVGLCVWLMGLLIGKHLEKYGLHTSGEASKFRSIAM